MKWLTLAVAACLSSTPAWAGDAPEFLLGDLGVRVDLPKRDWKMTRWSDWDFKGEKADGSVMVFAWATPVQVPITEDELDGWGAVYTAKVEELQGKSPEVEQVVLETIGQRPAAFADVKFSFGSGGAGVLYGATIEIANQDFHMAFVTAENRAKVAASARDELMRRLEVKEKGEPVHTPSNTEVEASGTTTRLPDGWRPPLKSEMAIAMKAIQQFGLDDITDCWLAVRPHPAVDPDVMVTCQGGLLLGVVDEYSFEGVDKVVRSKMFGAAEVPPAQRLDLEGRVGFLYAPPLESRGLAVGVVPYDKGVARTWAVGQPGDHSLAESVRAAIASTTYSGEHPASLGERISYYLTYRPTSPVVIVPVLGALLVVGVLVLGVGLLVVRSRRDKYADLGDD